LYVVGCNQVATSEDPLIENITRVKKVTKSVLVEDVINLEKESFLASLLEQLMCNQCRLKMFMLMT
jgi:hypothetical protein